MSQHRPTVDTVVFPSFIHLGIVSQNLPENYQLGAQNGYLSTGAFTGEVSMSQLSDFGVQWVLVGHSERRSIFKESNLDVAKKAQAALDHNLNVVACLGETEQERENGETQSVLKNQLDAYLDIIKNWDKVVIAYEPVWAIGTGKTATPELAEEVHVYIREELAKRSESLASSTRIIYGGSVKGNNAEELFEQKNIDGFLVGGASLNAGFIDIIRAAEN